MLGDHRNPAGPPGPPTFLHPHRDSVRAPRTREVDLTCGGYSLLCLLLRCGQRARQGWDNISGHISPTSREGPEAKQGREAGASRPRSSQPVFPSTKLLGPAGPAPAGPAPAISLHPVHLCFSSVYSLIRSKDGTAEC
jgi:hypothetical protein